MRSARRSPFWKLCGVILGDKTADRNPGLCVEQRQDRTKYLAAHTLIIDIYAFGKTWSSCSSKSGPVVQTRFKTQHLFCVAAFFTAAGNPDNTAPFQFADLADRRPPGPVAAATTRVSPGAGRPISSNPM